jgi:hypothetical protein
MIGTVPPAGGNCDESVTQSVLGTVETFHGTSSARAGKRAYLARDPFRRRMSCNVDPDKISTIQPDDDEGVEQLESNSKPIVGTTNKSIAAMSWARLRRKASRSARFACAPKNCKRPAAWMAELFQKQPAEQPREHAHRQEEARPAGYPPLAVQGNAPARNNHVDVRVAGERRSPGVQHGGAQR